MPMTGKERAALRAQAHHLTPLVHVGHQGLTPTLFQSLDDALRARELVKVQLTRTVDVPIRDVANALATAMAAEVVQMIGRTTTLYRHNPDLPRRPGDDPPWRV